MKLFPSIIQTANVVDKLARWEIAGGININNQWIITRLQCNKHTLHSQMSQNASKLYC